MSQTIQLDSARRARTARRQATEPARTSRLGARDFRTDHRLRPGRTEAEVGADLRRGGGSVVRGDDAQVTPAARLGGRVGGLVVLGRARGHRAGGLATASARATRSSVVGGGGSNSPSCRTTSQPRGAVRLRACGSQRSYVCGSANAANGPTTAVDSL